MHERKVDESPELNKSGTGLLPSQHSDFGNRLSASSEVNCGFEFPREQSGAEDDDEVTENKIRAFLEDKVFP